MMVNTMEEPIKLILWGWGREYLIHLNQFFSLIQKGEIEIVGITGNTLPPYSRLDGFQLLKPHEIPRQKYDYLMITNEVNEKEILSDALQLEGVTRDRILPYRILNIPYFSFARYLCLKKQRVSIISNNCWGGFLSSSLCLEHLSPFKNLYLEESDYLKCLRNLKHYCQEVTPVFKRWKKGKYEDPNAYFPVLALEDLELHCNHDDDPDAAIRTWMRRREKINWDNLFVEMTTVDKGLERDFNSLAQYPRKICFVPYETQEPYSLLVPEETSATWLDHVNANVRMWGGNTLFSMIDLLLGDIFLRVERDEIGSGRM